MKEIDQGTVLTGLRSSKYHGNRCHGVIITASCDIANKKVAQLYYLIGVKAEKWLCTEYAYQTVYRTKIDEAFQQFHKVCRECCLDAETLQRFSTEEVAKVIEAEVPKTSDQKRLKELYQNFSIFCKHDMDEAGIKTAIQQDIRPAVKFFNDVEKERVFHYFFLPEAFYLENSDKVDSGLLIDLQDIGVLSMEDATKIVTPGIDKLILDEETEQERERLKSRFWLESEDDFVGIEGKIVSPWREHLLQRFSRDFSRIGLDGAKEEDYKRLVQNI